MQCLAYFHVIAKHLPFHTNKNPRNLLACLSREIKNRERLEDPSRETKKREKPEDPSR